MSKASIPISHCRILWSTQTGRAKACARRTARLVRCNTKMNIIDENGKGFGCSFDDYGVDEFLSLSTNNNKPNGGSTNGTLKNTLLILFVSTTGDGEQCDTIKQTWKALLSKSLPTKTTFTNIKFALFCLGDRAYGEQFCAGGRKLAARLVQLGATPYCDVGYGDDGTPNGGVFADLDLWIEQTLLPSINSSNDSINVVYPQNVAVNEELEMRSPYKVEVERRNNQILNNDDNKNNDIEEWERPEYNEQYNNFFATLCPLNAYQYDNKSGQRIINKPIDGSQGRGIPPLIGSVLSNNRITESNWEQDTRHIVARVNMNNTSDNDQTSKDNASMIDITTGATMSTQVLPPSSSNILPYQAGDVATILPSNTEHEVTKFLQVLPKSIQAIADCELNIDERMRSGDKKNESWPSRCTLRGLLTYCADIHSLPEREDLRDLSRFCRKEHPAGTDQRDKLISLSETSGAALYADYVLREKRSWADVLYDFDSIRWQKAQDNGNYNTVHNIDDENGLTVEYLLALLQPIRPRHFSIASSPSQQRRDKHSFNVELCVAVVKGTTPLGRSYNGLCSSYLSTRLCPTVIIANNETTMKFSRLRVWIQPGSFGKLPLAVKQNTGSNQISINAQPMFETPVLCIGAGTGIAPLRSIILEREAIRNPYLSSEGTYDAKLATTHNQPKSSCDNILIFGCRKEGADFYYKDEWEILNNEGHLNIHTAFSRDQWHKIYVQQVLRKAEDKDQLITNHVLMKGGAIYIAGGAKMAKAVKEELVDCLSKALSDGDDDTGNKQAKLVLKKLQRQGKFSVEAWS